MVTILVNPEQKLLLVLSCVNVCQCNNFFQANCIDSTAGAEAVFAGEVKKLRSEKIKPKEQITLEPYERDHAVVVGMYR